MTPKNIILTLAVAGGLAGGAAAGQPVDRAPGPVRTAVVAQVPEACAAAPASVARPAAHRAAEVRTATHRTADRAAEIRTATHRTADRAAGIHAAAPPGARVVLVCGAADAQAATLRLTAEGYDEVLWSGPEPRAAAGLLAPDHPATRYAALGG